MNCTELGLSIAYKVYVAYASSSTGSNFSLGTPLTTSKYIAFISLPSTATTPTASSFTGLWAALFGSGVLQSNVALASTATTTLTTLNTLTLPIGFWNIGDILRTKHVLACATPSTNNQTVSLWLSGNNLLSATPNFNYDGSKATINSIVIETEVAKLTSGTAAVVYSVKYVDSSSVVLFEDNAISSVLIDDSASYTTPLLIKGQCANGADSVTLYSASVIISHV